MDTTQKPDYAWTTLSTEAARYGGDDEAPLFTCFTAEQAVSEARSALAVCRLTPAERTDCEHTLAVVVQYYRESGLI